MTRADVFKLLDEERQHQADKWGTVLERPHELGGWLTIIRVYLRRAEDAWASSHGDAEALAEVRKLAALAVACMEQLA